jgi:ABC-type multidrug transport system fused ATPase/permease subunit
MLLVLVTVLFTYYQLQLFFRRSNVELQRLDSGSRAPMQAHFSELIDGSATIRAFGKHTERYFVDRVDRSLDDNHRCLLAFVSCNRWLGLRLDVLGALVSFAAAVVCWSLRRTLPPGLAGMMMIWAQVFTICLNFIIVNTTEAEAKLTSMQRVAQFLELEQEPPLYVADSPLHKAVPKLIDQAGEGVLPTKMTKTKNMKGNDSVDGGVQWPTIGSIEFQDVCLRYRPGLPLALSGVTATICGGERVGCIGRTGAGKSSLAVVLFRLVEPCSGRILVDGVDLSKLGLADVRGRAMSIIPQDPVIFASTLRYNLDPFVLASDEQVWRALEQVRMRDAVSSLPDKLESAVAEGGSNFSVGQVSHSR